MRDFIRRQYEEASDILRHEGRAIFAWRIIAKILALGVKLDHQLLFEMDLTQPVKRLHARVPCTIEEATEAQLDDLVDMRYPPVREFDETNLTDAEEYRVAAAEQSVARVRATGRTNMRLWLRAGEKCFVVRVEGEMAHANWVRFHGNAPVPGRAIDPKEGEIYMAEGYTVPKWRGLRLHDEVATHMLCYAKARGYKRAFTIVDWTNGRSKRSLPRIGWTPRGHHLFISPRRVRRMWMLRLGGDVEPIARDLLGEPIRLL